MAWLLQSYANRRRSSGDVALGKREECEAGLVCRTAGSGVTERPLGMGQLALDEIHHAQFVVGDSGVKQIDRLYLGAARDRLRFGLVVSAQGS